MFRLLPGIWERPASQGEPYKRTGLPGKNHEDANCAKGGDFDFSGAMHASRAELQRAIGAYASQLAIGHRQ